jgi:hypothetical protein
MLPGGSKNSSDSLVAANLNSDQMELAALYQGKASVLQGLQNVDPMQELASSGSNAASAGSNCPRTAWQKASHGKEFIPAETVHRPTPYGDIPSLYDLYVQAPSRNAIPQRFGAQVFRDGLRDLHAVLMDLPVGPDYRRTR